MCIDRVPILHIVLQWVRIKEDVEYARRVPRLDFPQDAVADH